VFKLQSHFSVVLIAALAAIGAVIAHAADIEISVAKLRTTNGKVVVCVWNQEADFPACDQQQPFRKAEMSAAEPKLIVFADVPDGTYAVSAYHDETGKLERNFIGIPKFGVGFRADGWPYPIGKPSFVKNKFDLTGKRIKIDIEMKYF
jgi:uncharacterized protein (DUF2141 family)